MDTIKTFFVTVLSAVWAYLDPIAGNIESLTGLFVLNFFVGFLTGMITNDEKFQLKKVRECFVWAASILVIVCAFYFIGERNGNDIETIFCIKTISVVAMWAFGTNILRNLCMLSKGYKPAYTMFYLLYIVLSAEFIKRIPSVREYVERDKQETADKLGEEYHKFEWNGNQEPIIENEDYES